MRQALTLALLLLLTVSLYAQLRLNVAGDAKITGRIDLASGANNMMIGKDAGTLTTGSFNTFLGIGSGAVNTTGESNTFVGLFAGYSNSIGKENTFMGAGAGLANTTGTNNTFVGLRAGYLNTDRHELVAIGDFALYNNGVGAILSIHGTWNTAIGSQAGYSNTTGYANTFSGYRAGYANTTGNTNTFSGNAAGDNNLTGSSNTFIGSDAGRSNTTGFQNTFIGEDAGHNNQTGSNLTAFGVEAGASFLPNTPINNAFVIGSHGLMTSSHSGTLGNITTQKITGYVNIGTASDGRMKKQVQEDVHGLDFILQLRPVSYQVDALKMDKFLRQGMEDLPAGKAEQSAEEKAQAQERKQTYQSYLREKSAIRYTGFIAQGPEKNKMEISGELFYRQARHENRP